MDKLDDLLNDYKIEFRHFKEKRTNRTYIYYLDKFVTDKKKLDHILKDIKKKLGTSCIECDTDYGKAYGFQGDHERNIKKYLLDNNIVDESKIK